MYYAAAFSFAMLILIAAIISYYDPRITPQTDNGKRLKTAAKIILGICALLLFLFGLNALGFFSAISEAYHTLTDPNTFKM